MLRLVALAAAMVLTWTTLELRPVEAAPVIDVDGGVPRTGVALRAAVAKHGIDGNVWLGKLRSVGGKRDTLVYVPRGLDPSRVIDLVVYMEGHGSFQDDAMDHRHAASIARLGGNRVFIAPDAPSSSHGSRKAKNPYWQRGCAERRCAGGHAAPGDFVAFLGEVRARVAAMSGADAGTLQFRLSLIGFSNGGKGIVNAVAQLVAVDFVVGGAPVRIGDVIFADANYGASWLGDTWRVLAARPELPRLTILVGNGQSNRQRAAAFWNVVAPGASAPARLRLVPLTLGHHPIGDVAVDYLAPAEAPAVASS